MRTIAKLFGRSPFGPLQAHMDQVSECMTLLRQAIDAFCQGDHDRVDTLSEQVANAEHKADVVKKDIRNHLPKSMFLAIAREELLDILLLQDAIADNAEDIGILLTLKRLACPDWLTEPLLAFVDKCFEAFEGVQQVNGELASLMESVFTGAEAERVKTIADSVAFTEHEADLLQRDLLKALFAHDAELTYSEFELWKKILSQIGELADMSDALAERVRLNLERK